MNGDNVYDLDDFDIEELLASMPSDEELEELFASMPSKEEFLAWFASLEDGSK